MEKRRTIATRVGEWRNETCERDMLAWIFPTAGRDTDGTRLVKNKQDFWLALFEKKKEGNLNIENIKTKGKRRENGRGRCLFFVITSKSAGQVENCFQYTAFACVTSPFLSLQEQRLPSVVTSERGNLTPPSFFVRV